MKHPQIPGQRRGEVKMFPEIGNESCISYFIFVYLTMIDSNFESALFWDIDPNSLDMNKHSRFIIQRVLSKGSFDDWVYLKKLYGLNKIKKECLQIRSIDKRTIGFLSNYFGIDKTQFRCYN